MSLLLDALQRASQEKAKAADRIPREPTMEIEPIPPLSLQTPPAEQPAVVDLPPLEPLPAGDAPLVESRQLSMMAEDLAPPSIAESSATARPAALEPEEVATPLASPARTAAAPLPEEPPAPSKAAETGPSQARAKASPQVARDIFLATAPRPRSKRPIVLAAIAAFVLAGVAGALFLLDRGMLPGLASAPVSQVAPVAEPPVVPPPTATPVDADPKPEKMATTEASPGKADAAAPPPSAQAQAPQPAEQRARSRRSGRETPSPVQPLFQAKAGGPSALETAYADLTAGRLAEATAGYRQALSRNPDERDALLGLAHIAHREGRREEARDYYQRVLRLSPDHPVAGSGLVALQLDGDSATSASRARELAERFPDSAAAHGALGSALAREGQLAEAQQAFFRALALEPSNPLHAYNLAVSLDRLHKYDQARAYYERALTLAERSPGRPAGFSKDDVRDRLQQFHLRSLER